MKQTAFYIAFIVLSLLGQNVFGQIASRQYAFLHIEEEQKYPYEDFTKNAQKHYTWIINGEKIKYKNGVYTINVNPVAQFDTIVFQHIFQREDIVRKDRKRVVDTSRITILCKFRANHKYKLAQILPGDFEIYSLDTFETKKNISVKLIHKNNSDTLYLQTWYPEQVVFSDTTINLSAANEKMEQSFAQHIVLNRNKTILFCNRIPIQKNVAFDLYFNFMHAENLEIVYDFETAKYVVKILN
ncbi:MAG: hypothetical protein ACRCYO_08430 [Bacteroidia bacterium]